MTQKEFEEMVENIRTSVQEGNTSVPEHYDLEGALGSVRRFVAKKLNSDRDDERLFLEGSPASLASALCDMLTLGLSLDDKSCYLFRKSRTSSQYVLRRSYYGTEKVVRELYPDCSIFAAVVYEGEAFDLGTFVNGRPVEILHHPNLECINSQPIVASYAVILDADGKVIGYGLLGKQALDAVRFGNGRPNPVWETYPEEMAKKSAINRACKALVFAIPSNFRTREIASAFDRTDSINTSDDDDDTVTTPTAATASRNANANTDASVNPVLAALGKTKRKNEETQVSPAPERPAVEKSADAGKGSEPATEEKACPSAPEETRPVMSKVDDGLDDEPLEDDENEFEGVETPDDENLDLPF